LKTGWIFNACLHTEHTGQKRLVRPVEEPSNNADNEDNFERSENMTELVSSDSVVVAGFLWFNLYVKGSFLELS
jgi:hypothetical protein